MNSLNSKHTKGFTIIEMLMVISLISILAVIILGTLNTTRSRARDSQRVSDLMQIRNAIELYRTSTGQPPPPSYGWSGGWYAQINNPCTDWGSPMPMSAYLVPTYIREMPEDPSSTSIPPSCTTNVDGWWYYYGIGSTVSGTSLVYTGDRNQYILCTKLENPTATINLGDIDSNWTNNNVNYCIKG